ncbi:hypothetical protein [Streptomyces sp. NBC_01262]|uniref:hypothetical protein n=1 Tax=Streptomyces sp. NBC_01262 TaxID=2903803 RepID=UPI002E3673FE|nr:hypothetical protein [Streptomyces sp. NBC_01262]
MTPDQEQRLLAEAIPDGSFGGPRSTPDAPPALRPRRPPRPVTAAEAAQHQADLLAALDGFDSRKQAIAAHSVTARTARHLRLVPNPARKAG